ncbi:hypothetical protein F5Y03DRAFT_139953 [Xylaria venustula]|nr:hypothetical protein F5Y03DRAFT_139953 [Xylaria venustula]
MAGCHALSWAIYASTRVTYKVLPTCYQTCMRLIGSLDFPKETNSLNKKRLVTEWPHGVSATCSVSTRDAVKISTGPRTMRESSIEKEPRSPAFLLGPPSCATRHAAVRPASPSTAGRSPHVTTHPTLAAAEKKPYRASRRSTSSLDAKYSLSMHGERDGRGRGGLESGESGRQEAQYADRPALDGQLLGILGDANNQCSGSIRKHHARDN